MLAYTQLYDAHSYFEQPNRLVKFDLLLSLYKVFVHNYEYMVNIKIIYVDDDDWSFVCHFCAYGWPNG